MCLCEERLELAGGTTTTLKTGRGTDTDMGKCRAGQESTFKRWDGDVIRNKNDGALAFPRTRGWIS